MMNLTDDTLRGHADAMAANYRTAWPTASTADVADYVAECMVKLTGARSAHDRDRTVSVWYDYITDNKG